MKRTFCDWCESEITNLRYDRVPWGSHRLDLCTTCFPHYQEFEREREAIAVRESANLDAALADLAARILARVKAMRPQILLEGNTVYGPTTFHIEPQGNAQLQ